MGWTNAAAIADAWATWAPGVDQGHSGAKGRRHFGRFVLSPNRQRQGCKGQADGQHGRRIHRDRKRNQLVPPHRGGEERDQRKKEEQRHVGPQHALVHTSQVAEQITMIHPTGGEGRKGHDVDRGMGPKREVPGESGFVRWTKLKHHYGEDDCEYPVGDRFQSPWAQFVLSRRSCRQSFAVGNSVVRTCDCRLQFAAPRG